MTIERDARLVSCGLTARLKSCPTRDRAQLSRGSFAVLLERGMSWGQARCVPGAALRCLRPWSAGAWRLRPAAEKSRLQPDVPDEPRSGPSAERRHIR